MKKWVKVTLSLLVSIFILFLFIALYSYWTLLSPVPDYSGELDVEGITSEVKIYRDQFAVPYIFASDEKDAAFALGFLHAQERLFQMDLLRRAGEGRLSEVFGSRALPFDKMFRTIGIYKSVIDSFDKLNPMTKRFLYTYSAGVNEYLKQAKGKYPVEFDVLGYDPYPWKPEHSLIISKMMAWLLNFSWWSDVSFAHLIQKLGAEKVKEILPDFPENEPTIIPFSVNYSAVTNEFVKTDKLFRRFIGFDGTHLGSNNWVVDGKHSISGKPIIANDPHLPLQAPATWYVAVIRSKDWHCSGFTLPGMPGIVIGKNQNISWVVTNVMADDSDFYIERLDSLKTKYLFNGKWRDLEIMKDTITVKDSSSVEIEIKKTHRGPIISDIHPYNILFPNVYQNPTVLSMRWTGLEFSDEPFAILSVSKAANWNEFREALRYFNSPGQNFVYADKEGNIGYICAAKLPIRKNQSPTIVSDGTTDMYDWIGYVPYDEMPKLYNPPQGFIASANNKTIENFRYHISNIWEPSSRIKRITELLKSKKNHSVEDFKKYQNDFYSHYAKSITKYVVDAFKNINYHDDNLRLAVELLRKWDYRMDLNSQIPSIYAVFLQYLIKNIFEDEMGQELLEEYIFLSNVPYRTVERLLIENNSSWFDDIRTEQKERRDDIIRKSLVSAVTQLENDLGKNIAMWQWGEIHKVTFKHIFHGASSWLDQLIDLGPYKVGGDGTTIFLGEYSFTSPFDVDVGPSMRYIFDFSKPDEFEFILTTGQSGYFMSDHYKDMTEMWLKGKYFRVKTDDLTILNSNYDLLTLKP